MVPRVFQASTRAFSLSLLFSSRAPKFLLDRPDVRTRVKSIGSYGGGIKEIPGSRGSGFDRELRVKLRVELRNASESRLLLP